MDMPEPLHELVEELGEALLGAMTTDPRAREIVGRIHEAGFEVALMLEATVALRAKSASEDSEASLELEVEVVSDPATEGGPEAPQESEQSTWSEEDKAFLRTFKISLD